MAGEALEGMRTREMVILGLMTVGVMTERFGNAILMYFGVMTVGMVTAGMMMTVGMVTVGMVTVGLMTVGILGLVTIEMVTVGLMNIGMVTAWILGMIIVGRILWMVNQRRNQRLIAKFVEQAVRDGQWEVFAALVPEVAHPADRDRSCIHAADFAARNGHLEVFKSLVLQIADQANRDRCCIDTAKSVARNGHLEVVRFLMLQIADQANRDRCCLDAAVSAVENGHLKVVKFLVSQVADQANRDRCCIDTAKSAARNGHLEVVKFLVPQVADRANRDRCCIVAATSAVEKGQWEVVKFLVLQIADQVNIDRCCIDTAKSAARNGHLEVVKFLVPQVADRANRDRCCIVAATSAVEKGQWEVVKFLMLQIADQANRDQCCLDAAVSAVENGHLEVVKFLVPQVADQANKDRCCIDTAKSAARNGHLEVVKFLMLQIADQANRDQCCLDAAVSAVENGHLEVVKFLVPQVADQANKDRCCIDTAKSAARNGHLEVVKFLVPQIAHQTNRDQCCLDAAESAAGYSYGKLEAVKLEESELADETNSMRYLKDLAEGFGRIGLAGFFFGNMTPQFESQVDVAAKENENRCYIRAAKIAVENSLLKFFKFLVPQFADKANRDRCCIKATKSALKNGQWEVVKFLVPHVTDQANRDRCCIDAAISAATNGDLEVVKFLVPQIADQANKDRCCIDAAEAAARNGHLEVVKFLVPQVTDQANRDRCCIDAAEYAATNGHLEVVKFLVPQVADQANRDRCCIDTAESAARYSYGKLEAVNLKEKQLADETNSKRHCKETAERVARVWRIDGYNPIVTPILEFESQFDVAAQESKNRCYISAAKSSVESGLLKFFKFLVPKVVDQEKRDRCCIKAAKSALENGQWEVVKFLISCLSSPDHKANLRFQCAVAACFRLCEDVVISLGLEPDWLFQSSTILSFTAARAIEGRNSVLTDTLSRMQPAQITQLLRLSISQRHVALAVTLINDERFTTEHVDQPDNTGATALMLAADADNHELIEKLIDLGASVRAEDSQGRTALSRACEAGHVRAAKTLIDRGADVSHRDGWDLTCAQVAQRFEQRQVLRLLDLSGARSPEASPAAAHRLDSGLHRLSDDSQQDRCLSEELHRLLSDAGFTEQRSRCQQRLADWLQLFARVLTQDGDRRHMTGSYAEGWANSLVQVNGRTAADSDIDWTVLVDGQMFHLEGGCERRKDSCRDTTQLPITEGHAQVAAGAGSQPAVAATACGVRPAQDMCHAIQCCSSYCENRMLLLSTGPVHLVRATRPSSTNELRVSFSFQEKVIMRQLSTVQGQLFTLIKFIFKRHLPLNLDTPGLKTYHAKTLLFFMLKKHGTHPSSEAWQPHNLITLLKESLDMMLSFIDSSSSPDECMPHFFMPDAPLYFKNAGIGGDFDNTKARVRDRLCELRSDIGGVVEQLRRLVRPLQSEKFYFHPFTLLPLTAPPVVTEIRKQTYPVELTCDIYEFYYKFADVYSVVHQCVSELQSESSDRDILMKQLSLLHELQWCKCAALCMTAMAHLKFGESEEAERLAMELQRHQVESGLKPQDIRIDLYQIKTKLPEDSDWAWRFCLPCDSPPRFPFLPEFTQTLFTARLSQPLSSHLYVNFRCLSWSLQAELLRNRAPAIAFDHWIEQLLGDPDLEELLTLAHYSDCRKHVELSLQQMKMIEKERRVAMETQDEEKIGWVRKKRWRVSNCSGSDSGAHRSREDEERRLWARARLRRDGADLGRLVAMETAAEQRDSWTHAKLNRMRLQ
ncbi:hypothetical protein BOX15_Mlig028056g1 [Macrostomum lignano]|uniref:Mab-21-like HhH/H2TH-like domain-containing protein n=1 Tax=Macrostomum lignano TaxID=282301 RepID=A0A267EJY0_9PLAT|nr:hypothetical protein BOX15_Mlig028056g1 [Macrostomum lignano]